MTKAGIFATIHAMPMSVRYDSDAREYRVTYPATDMPSATRREDCASYCDATDAVGTARAMRDHFDNLTPDQRAAVISGRYI